MNFNLWIARDFNFDLYLYYDEPMRGSGNWLEQAGRIYIDGNLYPNVQWETGAVKLVEAGE